MRLDNTPGVTIGSSKGMGIVFLGALIWRRREQPEHDLLRGYPRWLSSARSLTKTGRGKLKLSKANTYTGGTTVSKGTLLVTNRTGSATGTGAVQVNAGTLGGTGKISGRSNRDCNYRRDSGAGQWSEARQTYALNNTHV